jgi:hypothetical protein
MTFCELVSACRTQPHLMERLADRPEWSVFLQWYRVFDRLVREQDRERLDARVPDAACVHVLTASRTEYYLSGGYVRIRRVSPSDRALSAVEVFTSYGGGFLEDVNEYGLARVPDETRSRGTR